MRVLLLLLAAAIVVLAAAAANAVDVAAVELDRRADPHACWRQALPRGKGKRPPASSPNRACPKDRPDKSNGLCYRECKKKRMGQGGVCFDDCERTKFKVNGLVFCCTSNEVCSQLLSTVALKLPAALAKYSTDLALHPTRVVQHMQDLKALVEATVPLNLPICSTSLKDDDDEEEENAGDMDDEEEDAAEIQPIRLRGSNHEHDDDTESHVLDAAALVQLEKQYGNAIHLDAAMDQDDDDEDVEYLQLDAEAMAELEKKYGSPSWKEQREDVHYLPLDAEAMAELEIKYGDAALPHQNELEHATLDMEALEQLEKQFSYGESSRARFAAEDEPAESHELTMEAMEYIEKEFGPAKPSAASKRDDSADYMPLDEEAMSYIEAMFK